MTSTMGHGTKVCRDLLILLCRRTGLPEKLKRAHKSAVCTNCPNLWDLIVLWYTARLPKKDAGHFTSAIIALDYRVGWSILTLYNGAS